MQHVSMTRENIYQDLEFQDRNNYYVLDNTTNQQLPAENSLLQVSRKLRIWRTIALAAIAVVILVSTVGGFLFAWSSFSNSVCPQIILMDNKTKVQDLNTSIIDMKVCPPKVFVDNKNLWLLNTSDRDKKEYRCEYCDENWIYFVGKCYFLSNNSMNWTQGMKMCNENGSQLAKIESSAEELFLQGRVRGSFWIGLTKKDENWVWVDGSRLDNSKIFWINSQPDNRNGKENCVTLLVSQMVRGNRGWNDDICANRRQYICEKESITAVFPT